MVKTFDVIVLGMGANGSSALYHLSTTGLRVAGIDRFTPPHTFGSSHGQSRITRQAYHENPIYVPFIKEAYRCWEEIEKVSGKQLLLKTGGIMLGGADSGVVTGSLLSARTHGIGYEYLSENELRSRFPAFQPTPGTVGVLEKEAGILFPESCITTYLEEAGKNGAELYYNEKALEITPVAGGIEILTSRGKYSTAKLILSAGAWARELVAGIVDSGSAGSLDLPLTVERQVLYWFRNRDGGKQADLQPERLPVYIWEYAPGKMFYGFPDLGEGIKIAFHHAGVPLQPDELTQEVSQSEKKDMQAIVDKYLNMEAVYNYSAVCLYTNTPDEDFIIDYHPWHKNIILASPCSGHGFKFSSLTGQLLSELAREEKPLLDLSPFSVKRFQ